MTIIQKYYIKTFGCQQNEADSQRLSAAFAARGMKPARGYKDANYIIVNTCMVREKAENKAYGLINNLTQLKTDAAQHGRAVKIIVTGCMVGVAFRDASGKYLARLRSILPGVDEFMPIEEVGFNYEPVRREHEQMGLVPISNGCNNFCTFCVVPFTRGREISRPLEDILTECRDLKTRGYTSVMLLGQNVNSYGADLILGKENIQVMRDLSKTYFKDSHKKITEWQGMVPTYVKHLGRQRLPTLFPYLLQKVAQMGFTKVDFISSNPWDFSDDLITVIAQNKNITRTIHLPMQSGDNAVLKRMNRWYTREEYLALINKIKTA
ncbi:MAG: radical SAM protein, partial [Candidatus Roizmanbacteria bacterium]|nr:radical SAM protein [Candidatus Roizmanbacteria bacterium]